MYDSESYIDIRHLEYWDECIDDSYKDNDIPAEVVMIPQDQRCYGCFVRKWRRFFICFHNIVDLNETMFDNRVMTIKGDQL